MTMTYHEAVKQLEILFHQFNVQFFNGEVETPVIAVLPDTTSGAYGWCTTQKIWKSGEKEFYEINICAEHLNRPIKEVCATLIHEMVHLDNLKKGIKDTSGNGRYHNKKFKETAEARGLVIERVDGYGWTKTSLKPETAEWIENNVEIEKFDLVRVRNMRSGSGSNKGSDGQSSGEGEGDESTPKAKASKYKYYTCPCCGKKFYSIYEIKATCEDCNETFVRYK